VAHSRAAFETTKVQLAHIPAIDGHRTLVGVVEPGDQLMTWTCPRRSPTALPSRRGDVEVDAAQRFGWLRKGGVRSFEEANIRRTSRLPRDAVLGHRVAEANAGERQGRR